MKSRVLTSIGLIPLVLGAFFCASAFPILVLAWVVFMLCAREHATILRREEVWVASILMSALLLPAPPTSEFDSLAGLFALSLFGVGVWATYHCTKYLGSDGKDCSQAPFTALLLTNLWFLVPLFCLVKLHELAAGGHFWAPANPVLMATVPVWGGDTAAYFAGKAFGRHPLAPAISPKKTVEGSVANLAACALIAIPLGDWIGYPWWLGLICGVIAGVFGQLGDLFESYIKRKADIKDSGTLLPGHGGVLDRLDSILFTAPLVFAALVFFKLH